MRLDYAPSLSRASLIVAAVLALSTLTACGGGDNPLGPSALPAGGVVLSGTVIGASGSAGAGALSVRSMDATGTIRVSVQEDPAIAATVDSNGSFTLRGLPSGSFTLLFTRDGATLGALLFGSVLPNQELTITVSATGDSIVLLEEKRNGIGHGDVEIEGLVQSVLVLSPAGESRFLIDGRTVSARPGETAIREGNTSRSVADVTVGRRVHVKGVWLAAEAGTQPVLAHEIKLQGDAPTATPTPPPGASCMIDGGAVGRDIQLEGDVVSGGAAGFQLHVNGNRSTNPVDILASGASFECTPRSGPNAPTPEQCRASVTAGAKVHVSGTLTACSASSAQVSASKVIVQK